MPKRVLQGIIKSTKSEKTLIISVERRFRHPLYQKTVTRSSKYAVHYDVGTYNVGDVVKIIESRPISKTKKWRVLSNNL